MPGRERGFSIHERADGSVALSYDSTSKDVVADEREAMLASYAEVFRKLRLAFEVAGGVIVVHGWTDGNS